MKAQLRISHLPILAGLVVLAVAVPGIALAKGPMDARVDGPGLAQPITLDWGSSEADLTRLIDATGFWELPEPAVNKEPVGELGARYVVSFSVHDDVGAPATLALHAYPFAEPAPLVYAPAGQVYPMGTVPEGWRTASAALTTWFEAKGAEPVLAVAADLAPQSLEAPAASRPTTPWLLITLGGAAVLALAGLVVVFIRRREGVPAH